MPPDDKRSLLKARIVFTAKATSSDDTGSITRIVASSFQLLSSSVGLSALAVLGLDTLIAFLIVLSSLAFLSSRLNGDRRLFLFSSLVYRPFVVLLEVHPGLVTTAKSMVRLLQHERNLTC